MSNSRPRINPRHRTLDAERLAAALLDLAALVEPDQDDLDLGAHIQARITGSVGRSAREEKSA